MIAVPHHLPPARPSELTAQDGTYLGPRETHVQKTSYDVTSGCSM